MKKISSLLIFIFIFTACAPAAEVTVVPSATPLLISTATTIPQTPALWVSLAVPDDLRAVAQTWDIPLVDDAALATQKLDVTNSGALWIYALVAPFPTVTDDVTYADLESTWKGASSGPLAGHGLLLAESTLEAFTARWGEPATGAVRSVPSDEMLDIAWGDMSSWAIIPFEEIESKWKVLSVDGQSPIHKDFNADAYPLKINFGFL